MAGPTAWSPQATAIDPKITTPTLSTTGKVALDRHHFLLVADSTARTNTRQKACLFMRPPIHRKTAFATTGTRVNAGVRPNASAAPLLLFLVPLHLGRLVRLPNRTRRVQHFCGSFSEQI